MTAAPRHKRFTCRSSMLLSTVGPVTLQSASLVIFATVLVACGSGPDAKTARQEKISVEFDRCQRQEAYDRAQGQESEAAECWIAFLNQYRGFMTKAQEAYATEHANQPGNASHPRNVEPQACGACAGGFSATGNSEADLSRLTDRCRAACGIVPFSTVRVKAQDKSDDQDVFTIDLETSHCYFFFAVGGRGIQELHSGLYGADDQLVASDTADDAWPAFRYCPAAAGQYRYVVSVLRGGGTYHYQVWQTP